VLGVDVLVVSNEGDAHGDAVIAEVRSLDATAVRFNLGDVLRTPYRATPGAVELWVAGEWVHVSADTTLWWHRAGEVDIAGLDQEEAALVRDEGPHLLVGGLMSTEARWVDDPWRVARAEHKQWQLARAVGIGMTVPDTIVTNVIDVARDFASGRSVIAKPLSPGIGIAPFAAEVLDQDLEKVEACHTLLQELVPASADLRIVVVNSQSWVWRRPREVDTIDWRAVDADGRGFARQRNEQLEQASVTLTSALGLTMSVQDWLETSSGPVFLEANPQGAWLFLEGSTELVPAQLAQHLRNAEPSSPGKWPRARERLFLDFLPASKTPQNDGIEAPRRKTPDWIAAAASRPNALDVARRANDEAKAGVKSAEDKATRLVQVGFTLLTVALGLFGFQAKAALARSGAWLISPAVSVAAIVFLIVAVLEALQIDRVGFYMHPSAEDLVGFGSHNASVQLLAIEEEGRNLASWSSVHKHSDLMQARAWFSRGVLTLVLAGVVGALTFATGNQTSHAKPTARPGLTPAATATTPNTARPTARLSPPSLGP
jgi:glutathione synthase/RimK-type ligase-like ATP-grasp enzyme